MLVELKSGETYNGHLAQCDNYMNLTLRNVVLTSKVRLVEARSLILCLRVGSPRMSTSVWARLCI